MKRKHIYAIVLCFISMIGFSLVSSGQRCDKKDLCNDEDYGDYDFKSQTHFAKLSPGDTATINIVAYSGNDMRILICVDPDLGDVKYQVVESKRDPVREVKYKQRTEKNPQFGPEDQDGNRPIKLDKNGDTLFTIENFTDTIVTTRFNVYDKTLFDNSKQTKEKPYYEEKNITKTKRLKIKIQIPKGTEDDDYIGCVNVLVGRKGTKSNKFYRGKD